MEEFLKAIKDELASLQVQIDKITLIPFVIKAKVVHLGKNEVLFYIVLDFSNKKITLLTSTGEVIL